MNAQSASIARSQHLVPRAGETDFSFNRNYVGLVASLGFVALLCVSSSTWAQVAPTLGVAKQFGVLGNSAVTGSTGFGVVVNGDVGSYPTSSVSNFPPSSAAGPYIVHYAADGVVQQAHADAIAAFGFLSQGPSTTLNDDLSTVGALSPGIYSLNTPNLPTTTTLTLNDPTGTGIFIFKVAVSLTADVLSKVTGTANPCNVYWQIGVDATLNGDNFWGTVIAGRSITVGATNANVQGRLLAGTGPTGAVTIAAASAAGHIIGGCSTVVTPPIVVPPAPPNGSGVGLSKAFFPATINVGGVSTLAITLLNNTGSPITLTSPLTDTLPGGLVIATTPTASTTCTGGTLLSAPAGGTAVTLGVGWTIPAGAPYGACTVFVNVTAPVGSYPNTLGTCTLNVGSAVPVCNAEPASATLIVFGQGGAIPTLSEWAMIVLAALLAIAGFAAMRRRAR